PKLFEMPLAGYLGYLPFLLECTAALALVERVRLGTRGILLAALSLTGFHLGVESLSRSSTALSRSATAAEISALPLGDRDGLLACAIANRMLTPDRFWVQWIALAWGGLFAVHLWVFSRSTLATMGGRRRQGRSPPG